MTNERVRTEEFRVDGEKLIGKIKEVIHEGNIRRIIIKDNRNWLTRQGAASGPRADASRISLLRFDWQASAAPINRWEVLRGAAHPRVGSTIGTVRKHDANTTERKVRSKKAAHSERI